MPDPDEKKPSEKRRKSTREVQLSPAGEVLIPDQEQPANPAPRTIHRRRPLPAVPKKSQDPGPATPGGTDGSEVQH